MSLDIGARRHSKMIGNHYKTKHVFLNISLNIGAWRYSKMIGTHCKKQVFLNISLDIGALPHSKMIGTHCKKHIFLNMSPVQRAACLNFLWNISIHSSMYLYILATPRMHDRDDTHEAYWLRHRKMF